MSYSTYCGLLYSVPILLLCLLAECAWGPSRPDDLKVVLAQYIINPCFLNVKPFPLLLVIGLAAERSYAPRFPV